ncbi:hypothetical protein D3C81_1789930 [compost metagenome]
MLTLSFFLRYAGYIGYAPHIGAEWARRPWSRWQLLQFKPLPTASGIKRRVSTNSAWPWRTILPKALSGNSLSAGGTNCGAACTPGTFNCDWSSMAIGAAWAVPMANSNRAGIKGFMA